MLFSHLQPFFRNIFYITLHTHLLFLGSSQFATAIDIFLGKTHDEGFVMHFLDL
uniref:AlNc14C231G9293 protein n=1 Tax=Albugo laibachii Nc14 TaxID=890382 RepID=F0WSF2_9STRA|nr:AlNc14C231G9293 [Albugo laibachii Nc14]|eukprot:CCA24273.1 AlNc14C231G9293 [Albugo laibachii Nc14]